MIKLFHKMIDNNFRKMDKRKTVAKENAQRNICKSYSFTEDMAIVNYMTKNDNYLKASGVQVWKDAEKLQICPGRSYLSLKERFRKVIVKNLKKYKVDKDLALNIQEFLRANPQGKRTIRFKQSSE